MNNTDLITINRLFNIIPINNSPELSWIHKEDNILLIFVSNAFDIDMKRMTLSNHLLKARYRFDNNNPNKIIASFY
jgi:hypothetical protein